MSVESAVARSGRRAPTVGWEQARAQVYAAGRAAALPPVDVPLADADGLTLAEPLTTLTDLPAFPTSSVDGWAVRGPGRGGWSAGCWPAARRRR